LWIVIGFGLSWQPYQTADMGAPTAEMMNFAALLATH
jgi:hypothetical protein